MQGNTQFLMVGAACPALPRCSASGSGAGQKK